MYLDWGVWRLAPLEDVRSDIHSPAHFHVRGPTNGPIISWGPCSIMLMITVPSVDSPRQWVCPVSGFAPSVGSPHEWACPVSGHSRSVICSRPGLAGDASQASHYGRGVALVKFQTFPLLVRSYGDIVWLVVKTSPA